MEKPNLWNINQWATTSLRAMHLETEKRYRLKKGTTVIQITLFDVVQHLVSTALYGVEASYITPFCRGGECISHLTALPTIYLLYVDIGA